MLEDEEVADTEVAVSSLVSESCLAVLVLSLVLLLVLSLALLLLLEIVVGSFCSCAGVG